MTNKPLLYVPDFPDYAEPFSNMFDVVTSTRPYDLEIAKVADIVMLTGGGDIHPKYYGQSKHPATHTYGDRDEHEHKLIQQCLDRGQFMLGICRGAEWLAIAAGGKLFQHVSGHNQNHGIKWGNIDFLIHATSLHHQMCDLREVKDAKVLAWADGISMFYEGEKTLVNIVPPNSLQEPEVFTIPSIKGFGIQGHPEMATDNGHYNTLCRLALASFLSMEPDPDDNARFQTVLKTQKAV